MQHLWFLSWTKDHFGKIQGLVSFSLLNLVFIISFFFFCCCVGWKGEEGSPSPSPRSFFFFSFLLLIITSLFLLSNSTFTDIFDERHFISTLRGDVRIVKQLPKELESASRARKHFTTWSSMSYYEEMTHLWRDYQVLFIRK